MKSFESENLQVDYLTFNIRSKEPERLQKIADYFSKNFQCNSFLLDVQDSTKNRVLSQKHKKYCKAEFRTNYTKYWPGTIISFSGNHARFFYETIKNKQLDKDIFDLNSTNIGRIDLCYNRKFKQSDCVQTLDSFLKNSCTKINSKVDNPKAEVVKGIFRVGKRSSPNYFRVYPKSNGKFIRFELELAKAVVKKFQFYLFSNQFEKLEELLCIHFYEQALSSFVKDSVYTDWLLENFRNMRSSRRYENSLITTYLKNLPLKTIEKQEFLYKLLQLLSYIRTLESSVNWISNENYRVVSFRVSEFFEFLGKKKTNYYQIRKLVDFLKSLQSLPPVLEDFSKESFRSILIFPYLEVRKEKSWTVELAIAEKVYLYRYPFYFPKEFLTYDDAYDLRAKIFFLLSFSTTELKKEFEIQEVLDRIRLSPQKMRKLRKSILITFEDAKNLKVIEPQFTLLMKAKKLRN